MAQTVQYRKGLSSQNQCHRELVVAERVAGADSLGSGAKQEKIQMDMATFDAKALGVS